MSYSYSHLVLFRCVFKRSGDFIQASERVREVLMSWLILMFVHSDTQQKKNQCSGSSFVGRYLHCVGEGVSLLH